MSERLKGKVAIVTGSTQGIGLAIARRFAAEGAMVTLNSHREDDAARAITAELGPERSLFVHADVADRAAMEGLAARTIERFGKVDILINNAGMNVFDDPLALSEEKTGSAASPSTWKAHGTARAPPMLAQGAGSIVNIASVHGHKIIPAASLPGRQARFDRHDRAWAWNTRRAASASTRSRRA
jgi:NAD(P)-dependent dehydrogenase (short-subunit alcohol dehydrogenase family)